MPLQLGWRRFVDGLGMLGSLLIFALMLLICADVVGRNGFNSPIPVVAEVGALSVVMITFLQLGSTVRRGRMARADLFILPFSRRRPAAGRLICGLFDLLGFAACALMTAATWPILLRDFKVGEYVGVQGVLTLPTWPFRILILLGLAVASLQYLINAFAGADHVRAKAL